VILGEYNAEGDFGGRLVGRPIEGDRSDGIAVKTALGFLGEPEPKWLSSLPLTLLCKLEKAEYTKALLSFNGQSREHREVFVASSLIMGRREAR
jgi:hypothetical protein